MDHERWYDYVYPKNLNQFQKEKILTPEISYGPNFTYDTEGIYHTTKVYGVLSEFTNMSSKYMLAVLNSPVLWFFLSNTGYTLRGGYFTFKTNYLNPFSIPDVSPGADEEVLQRGKDWYKKYLDGRDLVSCPLLTEGQEQRETVHDYLCILAEKMIDLNEKQENLSLKLLDYLGNYENGPNLPDIGLFQPTSSNILNATTEEYEKLQVESARTRRNGSTITIEATARYKPADEEEFETDTYGYTETDFFEAFTLTNLSEEEAALVEAFVPIAVEEEIGGFRDNATKNNSLIDRLKSMTLPDPDDVADDLRRYIETKEHADELDEKIEKTDQLIDEIVYDLYDLTEEEIEIIEEAVADD